MTATFRASLVALLGLGLLSTPALASKPAAQTPSKGQMKVYDDDKVFSPDAVTKAEAKFNNVEFKARTQLTVRAFDKLPSERKTDFAKLKTDDERRHYMTDWATTVSQAEGDKGVVLLVCNEAKLIAVVADRETKEYRSFGDADAAKVKKALASGFEAAKDAKTDDEKRAARGDGLTKATDEVISQLRNTTAPAEKGSGTTSGNTNASGDEPKKSGGWSIWMWMITIIGILLVVWIIVAIIRAMTGNVYGGMYAGGGGYGYGGGGPGFFGCFMGGMFGAMAGMWMYNSMMGTHYAHDPSMASGADGYGDTGGATDTGAGDFDNGADAAGGWDDAGGDAGGDGGGGDWGDSGGGDTGGGGDWGGDSGGGGGDWGGGGGDFGGGGGDW